jgi:hypothetical protein
MADESPSPSGGGASSRPGDVVDLDVLRAARLETIPERVVRFGGRDFTLVPEVPFVYGETWRSGRQVEATKMLFAVEGDAEQFFKLNPSGLDISALVDVYNVPLGKSSAS